MALSDTPPETTKRGGCAISRQGFTDAELALLESWLADDRYPDSKVSERLAQDGYLISHQIIGRHRTGRCGCDR